MNNSGLDGRGLSTCWNPDCRCRLLPKSRRLPFSGFLPLDVSSPAVGDIFRSGRCRCVDGRDLSTCWNPDCRCRLLPKSRRLPFTGFSPRCFVEPLQRTHQQRPLLRMSPTAGDEMSRGRNPENGRRRNFGRRRRHRQSGFQHTDRPRPSSPELLKKHQPGFDLGRRRDGDFSSFLRVQTGIHSASSKTNTGAFSEVETIERRASYTITS